MCNFKNITFIVNPISGNGKGDKVIEYIKKNIPSDFIKSIKETQKKYDAYNYAKESLSDGTDLVVSCGGDGTLNEVASALLKSDIPIYIIPIGSGNGLARHLKISMNFKKAIKAIFSKDYFIEKIDCGRVNQHYFFSNIGIGLDSKIIEIYSNQKIRKLIGYIRASLLAIINYKPVKINIQNVDYDVMLFIISNSNCMGYNFSFTHKASIKDGLFDANLILKTNWFMVLIISMSLFLGMDIKFKKRKFLSNNKIIIKTNSDYIQIDGEPQKISSQILDVEILSKSLKVLVNKNFN